MGAGPKSTYVISITPFTADGRLDESGFRAHLRRLAAAGIGVYVGGGGSGEGYTLDGAETRRVLEIAVEELKGVVPVRSMGTEPRTAQELVAYIRLAASIGVDATQVYSLDVGHGHQPTMAEIETYFTDILEPVTVMGVPAILSTHQSVGYRIPIDMIARLVERFGLIGVNCSHGDPGYLVHLIDAVGDRTEIHVGGPIQGLSALALGAEGFLTSEGNLAPRLCASVVDLFEKGDLPGTFDAFAKVVRLFDLLYGNGGIRATKAVLNHYGLAGGYPRKPQLPVGDDVATAIAAAIDAMGIPAIEGW
ncbi:MAG TPA: dihydrodipicolinate synthase family protein [Acidimicrobiales bacterium]|nr:dihydrodipicolinate synthase family protein [Acidimicrobiales bacterium]